MGFRSITVLDCRGGVVILVFALCSVCRMEWCTDVEVVFYEWDWNGVVGLGWDAAGLEWRMSLMEERILTEHSETHRES